MNDLRENEYVEMSKLKLGIFQGQCPNTGSEARLVLFEQATKKAQAESVALLVFPELFMSGYNIGDAVQKLAEPSDGEFATAVAAIAKSYSVAVIYGYPERDGDSIYNSLIAFDANGIRLANYRKIHLAPGHYERPNFRCGDQFAMFELVGFHIAPLVCYDVEFPEAVRTCVLNGADLVIVPTALREQYKHVATRLIPTRAFENGVYVAYANHCGQENEWSYCGHSIIAAPNGEILVQAGNGEQLIIATIERKNIEQARSTINYLGDRKTNLYKI